MKVQPTDLKDEEVFTPYQNCPDEVEITYGGCLPIHHWCFLGEITESVVTTRLCLTVKDRMGKEVTVSFYLDSPESGGGSLGGFKYFTPGIFPVHPNIPKSLTKKGNTIAILYPQQHEFADTSIGFRIENGDYVQFFPCTLERLLALGDRILSRAKGGRACYKCNKTASQRCSGCNVTRYCGKDCQAGDWSDGGHKKDCKLLRQVATLMKQDWEDFNEYYTFPLPEG